METGTIISISLYIAVLLAIGFYSYRRTHDIQDYMLGGRNLGPLVTALSAGASDMSGWMLMGLPGAVYATGISNLWIGIGLTIGAYFNYRLLAPRFRIYTEVSNNSLTIPDYLENRFKDKSSVLRLASGTFILVFFTLYVSSGIVAGGKLFLNLFDSTYTMGVIITLAIVVVYTFFGGFLAVSLTDFFQGTLMFICLVLVPVVTFITIGSDPVTFAGQVSALDPELMNIFRGTSVLSIISLLAWGLGYFGQPHIIVRFMAIKSAGELKSARRIGIGWMSIGLLGAIFSGLAGLVYFNMKGTPLSDPETVFVKLGDVLFHPLITGVILCAVLAAIMSTISSQLLVCSSSVTKDFYMTFLNKHASPQFQVTVSRISVLLVAAVATYLAYLPNKSILSIVSQAWAGFGASFGSVLLISLYWRDMTKWGALAGMVVGGLTVIIWINAGLSAFLYEMIPGFGLSFLSVIIVSKLTAKSSKAINDEFDIMEQHLEKHSL